MWNEVEKESYCSDCKHTLLCNNDVDYSLRFRRCCGSSPKHMDYRKVAGGVGCKHVVFPVIDVILAVLLFVKIGLAYLDYRKHGQLEWTPIAIIFGCLIFTLTAPLYIWSIV